MLLSDADILPDPAQQRLVVRLHSLANPRSNAALATLCDSLNTLAVVYPGTTLRLDLRGPPRCIDFYAHVRSPEVSCGVPARSRRLVVF